MVMRRKLIAVGCVGLLLAAAILVSGGCGPAKREIANLSGKVTFKGQPVPAGYIQFSPNVAVGTLGSIRVLQIKDGVYDSSKESEPGINPGEYLIKIAGFDGKRIPMYGQGKQIFNPMDGTCTVPAGATTKDFVIPDSYGENVKIQPTADT